MNRRAKTNRVRSAGSKIKGDLVEDIVALLYRGTDVIVQTRIRLPVVRQPTCRREVDVLVTGLLAGHPVRLAIECKNYGRPIGVEKIGEFRDKLDDIGIPPQLGIFITAGSFTGDALERARNLGMHALLLTGLTPDRMAAEVHEAFQSVVHLLLEIAKIEFITENLEPGPGALLTMKDESGHVAGYLPDLVWAEWRDGALPTDLGEHSFHPALPEGWSWSTIGDVAARSVKVQLRVVGTVITIPGQSQHLGLVDPTTRTRERIHLRGSFDLSQRSFPVTVVQTESELSELRTSRARLGASITIGRNRLPRIRFDKMYWPPSDHAMETIPALVRRQVTEGTFDVSMLGQLTFEQVEGENLSRVWDSIAGAHPAAHDPKWSPFRRDQQ